MPKSIVTTSPIIENRMITEYLGPIIAHEVLLYQSHTQQSQTSLEVSLTLIKVK